MTIIISIPYQDGLAVIADKRWTKKDSGERGDDMPKLISCGQYTLVTSCGTATDGTKANGEWNFSFSASALLRDTIRQLKVHGDLSSYKERIENALLKGFQKFLHTKGGKGFPCNDGDEPIFRSRIHHFDSKNKRFQAINLSMFYTGGQAILSRLPFENAYERVLLGDADILLKYDSGELDDPKSPGPMRILREDYSVTDLSESEAMRTGANLVWLLHRDMSSLPFDEQTVSRMCDVAVIRRVNGFKMIATDLYFEDDVAIPATPA